MKQMTKEELIEYFIEQLGDNEILGQVMTIEQIKEKLNTVIKDVTYENEREINKAASWRVQQDGTGIVNFDINKITKHHERSIIVHELLHALSTTAITINKNYEYEKKKQKIGLEIDTTYYSSNGDINSNRENVAINEGLIDFLAMQITGIDNSGYGNEKDIYQLLSQVIGSDVMIKKAFITEASISQQPRDLFKEDLISKYGESLGVELNESVKKILTLSDQLLDLSDKDIVYGLNENGRRIQQETKQEIYETLTLMLEKVVENEQDSKKLLDMVKLVPYIHEIQSKLCKSVYDRIYDLYVEKGKISDGTFSKRKIFEQCIKASSVYGMDQFDSRLAKIKYRQVGEYYEVFGISKKGRLYNSDGRSVESSDNTLWSFSSNNDEIVDEFDREKLLGIVDENNISILLEQLKIKEKDFNEKRKDLTEILQDTQKYYMDVSVNGNIIKLEYDSYYEFYSVNSDGLLEQIEIRRRKKIYR